jgi:hypothetical protein
MKRQNPRLIENIIGKNKRGSNVALGRWFETAR